MLQPVATLTPHLLGWYDTVHTNRDMPWRRTTDPYAIWLSETMLQQTQVATVKPYFARFLGAFPTVRALAEAPLDAVLALWAGLGYYRRARHLHAAAQAMVERFEGRVPATVEELMTLPGVGRYTAGAVASIAYGVAAPVVDGNVMRVVARLTGYEGDVASPKSAPFFWKVAGEIVAGAQATGRYGDTNQAMMELGATVCVPANPACLVCPVREWCRAFSESRQMELPVKGKKKAVPEVEGVAVVLVKGGKTLVMRRPDDVVWGGMWEFPVVGEGRVGTDGVGKNEGKNGGKGCNTGGVEGGVEAWIGQVLGVRVRRLEACGEVVHTLTHRRMKYRVVRCEVAGTYGEVKLPACREGGNYAEAKWVGWPLEKGNGLAYGRVVEKIAAAALGGGAG